MKSSTRPATNTMAAHPRTTVMSRCRPNAIAVPKSARQMPTPPNSATGRRCHRSSRGCATRPNRCDAKRHAGTSASDTGSAIANSGARIGIEGFTHDNRVAMISLSVIPEEVDRQRRLVGVAAAVTVLLGLVFVFVRPPHPFGWGGIDHYDTLGMRLARGGGFPTTDVPWGYAYFLAVFYRLFGDRAWVPLVAQVLLNGLVPPLLYRIVRP